MLIENEIYCQADPRITLTDYPRFTAHKRQLELIQNISASKRKMEHVDEWAQAVRNIQAYAIPALQSRLVIAMSS